MTKTATRASKRNAPAAAATLSLAALQDAFQRAIRDGDDAVLAHITDGPRTTRNVLLGVYRHAYGARLVEIMGKDHPTLLAYLGEEAFDDMARHYIAERPSHSPNARDVSHALPEFLAEVAPYSRFAHVGEIAAIERALGDVFDAADAPVLRLEHLAQIPADAWPQLVLVPHAATRLLTCSTNAFDIWRAVNGEFEPPQGAQLETAQHLLAWRDGVTPRIRALDAEEAMIFIEASRSTPFARLCELAAVHDDAESAPARVAGYLQSWLAGGVICGYRL